MESQFVIEANIIYESFKDWIFIKDIIKSSNNVNSFKVSNLTAQEAYVKIRIINENKFMAELEK